MITEKDKNFRTKDLTQTEIHINSISVKTKGKKFDKRNLPDRAGELRDGDVRTASLVPHTSPALSGSSFQGK